MRIDSSNSCQVLLYSYTLLLEYVLLSATIGGLGVRMFVASEKVRSIGEHLTKFFFIWVATISGSQVTLC